MYGIMLLQIIVFSTVKSQEKTTDFHNHLSKKPRTLFKQLMDALRTKKFVASCEKFLTTCRSEKLSTSCNVYCSNKLYLVDWHIYKNKTFGDVLNNKEFFSNYDLLSPYKELLRESYYYRK